MTLRLQSFFAGLLALLVAVLLALGSSSAKPASGGYQLFEPIALEHQHHIQLASLGNFDYFAKVTSECCNAPKGGLDDLISGGTRRSADEVNASFPEGYSAPYTPGTQVTEFVSDGSQTFVRVVSGDSPGGQWVMKASDIEGLSPQQIADKFALPEVPTGITSVTPPAGTRIRTGEVNPNFGGAGGGTQFQLLDRVNEGWADVTPLQ